MGMKRIFLLTICIILLSTCFAYAANGHTDVTSVTLAKHNITLVEGNYSSIKVSYAYVGPQEQTDISWSSSNTNVATVTNKGLIKAKHKGKTTIEVNIEGETDCCEIEIKADTPVYINAKQCYTELNKYRKKGKKLKKDAKLEKIAKLRAKEIAVSGKFSHTRPNGKSSLTLIKGNKHKGENIAMGRFNAKSVTEAWYNSKGHRQNMVRKQFKKVGIASCRYKGNTYWVQIFSS